MRTRITLIAVLAMLVPAGANAGRAADRPELVASFYPIAYATHEIAGSGYAVSNLTPAGSEPHDLELKPSAVTRIAHARLVFYLGRGFQPAVERAVQSTHAHGLDLLAGQTLVVGAAGDGNAALDPHVWLDPVRYSRMAQTIGKALDREPAARPFASRLHALDASYRRGLADCRRRTIVTSHAAFGYLARRYGLTQLALQGLTPEAEPSPRSLARLIEAVKRTRATTVFFETLVSPKLAQAIARGAHVETAVLDPVEGLSQTAIDGGATYFTVMRRNLAALRSALGCGD